ncbi:MAG: hypothetical protein V4671_29295, partial [Armatimonadota bacterium]
TLAAILRIPVDMHNVPADRVFRPSSWARFGAMEPQSADYRACATYGPLYKSQRVSRHQKESQMALFFGFDC